MNLMQRMMALMPGMISCKQFDEQLDEYIEGELSFGGRIRMAIHKVICRACALYAVAYQKTIGAVKASIEDQDIQAADEPVSEDIVQDILNHQLKRGHNH